MNVGGLLDRARERTRRWIRPGVSANPVGWEVVVVGFVGLVGVLDYNLVRGKGPR
jgi:hypothetical protein